MSRLRQGILAAGALGCSLSGSGPSVFALCASRAGAERAATAMVAAFEDAGLASDRYVSAVGSEGVKTLPTPPAQ